MKTTMTITQTLLRPMSSVANYAGRSKLTISLETLATADLVTLFRVDVSCGRDLLKDPRGFRYKQLSAQIGNGNGSQPFPCLHWSKLEDQNTK